VGHQNSRLPLLITYHPHTEQPSSIAEWISLSQGSLSVSNNYFVLLQNK